MIKHQTISISNDNGTEVLAQAPLIISASRATDIPAFYADWFFRRLDKGYVRWRNPFSGQDNYVSFGNTRFIVFSGVTYNIPLMITKPKGWSQTFPPYSSG